MIFQPARRLLRLHPHLLLVPTKWALVQVQASGIPKDIWTMKNALLAVTRVFVKSVLPPLYGL